MSLLQEYEEIGTKVGAKKQSNIQQFLSFHPEFVLSDVYYNQDVWKQFEEWNAKTPDYFKNEEALLLVTENYKGLAEHNFFGTIEEIGRKFDLSEKEMMKFFYHLVDKEGGLEPLRNSGCANYGIRPDVTYTFWVAKSEQALVDFLSGKTNDLERQDVDEDWYYDLNPEECGEKGLEIIRNIVGHTKNKELLSIIEEKNLNWAYKPNLDTLIAAGQKTKENKEAGSSDKNKGPVEFDR